MCVRRNEIDEGAEDIAEEVVTEIPATTSEFRDALPNDIDDLIEETPKESVREFPDEIADKTSLDSIISNTPLEKYYD